MYRKHEASLCLNSRLWQHGSCFPSPLRVFPPFPLSAFDLMTLLRARQLKKNRANLTTPHESLVPRPLPEKQGWWTAILFVTIPKERANGQNKFPAWIVKGKHSNKAHNNHYKRGALGAHFTAISAHTCSIPQPNANWLNPPRALLSPPRAVCFPAVVVVHGRHRGTASTSYPARPLNSLHTTVETGSNHTPYTTFVTAASPQPLPESKTSRRTPPPLPSTPSPLRRRPSP